MPERFEVPPDLFKPKRPNEIPTDFNDRELKRTEKVLGVKLPGTFVEVLKVRNGGSLRLTKFKMKRKPPKRSDWSHSQTYHVGSLPGVHPDHPDGLVTRFRDGREWQLDKGLIPLDGDGHRWLCLDYRACGPAGEPAITHWEEGDPRVDAKDPSPLTYRVADSVRQLVLGLYRAADDLQPAAIALDGVSVRGERLAKALKSLGCKKHKFVGVRSQTPLPPTWVWDEYKSYIKGWSASFELLKNATFDRKPLFSERPLNHPLLMVKVVPKEAERCLAELLEALGPKATVLRGIE